MRISDCSSDVCSSDLTGGSLGTRTAACSHAYPGAGGHGMLTVDHRTLLDMMTRATAAGLACFVHAIGDIANTSALDAFAATGAMGTIEHAQLVGHTDIPRFARLGVSASADRKSVVSVTSVSVRVEHRGRRKVKK